MSAFTRASLLSFLQTVARRPLFAGLVAAVVVAMLSLLLPDQFKSEARVLPADARSSAGGASAAAAAAVGITLPGQESPDAAFVDILNSRLLREALLTTRFRFHVRTWRFGLEQAREQTLYDYLGARNMDRAVRMLKDRVTITRDLKTKLLTITMETESPELSQQAAQRLVMLLNDFVVGKAQTRGGAKAAFAEKRLDMARGELALAEDTLRSFLDSNRNYLLSPDPAIRLKGMRLDNELKLRTQLVTTLAITREQALLEEKNDMPILNILDRGNLPIEKSGPARSVMVVMSLLLVSGVCRLYQDRERVRRLLAFG
jgi:uncharacterized protein involved in exopolysaccharide biosynthesis